MPLPLRVQFVRAGTYAEAYEEKFSRWFPQLKWLNLGGGHLMTRKDYDVEHLIGLLKGLKARYPHLQIILEPGSAFAWQTGPLVASVVDVVEMPGNPYGDSRCKLYVPHARLSGDALPALAVRGAESLPADAVKTAGPEAHVYRLGGNSCLSGDYMGSWKSTMKCRWANLDCVRGHDSLHDGEDEYVQRYSPSVYCPVS